MKFTARLNAKLALRAPWVAFAFASCLTTVGVQAQTAASLQMRSLAATCASCHGTEGNAVQGEALVRLAGLPKDYFVSQMLAFREGKRPATEMHQLSKGYSPEQIEAMAIYFAALK